MADPTKSPGHLGPDEVRRRETVDPRSPPVGSPPVVRSRRSYAWAWIVAIIIVLSLIWAVWGTDRQPRAVQPVVSPAPAASTVR